MLTGERGEGEIPLLNTYIRTYTPQELSVYKIHQHDSYTSAISNTNHFTGISASITTYPHLQLAHRDTGSIPEYYN